jgi:hypothetical protein
MLCGGDEGCRVVGFHGRSEGFDRVEGEAQPRGEEDGSAAEGGAEADAANCFDAVVIELNADELGRGGGADPDGREEVVFQPAADAEEGEVVALFHAQPEIAKEAEETLGILALAEFPAEIEQEVGFFPADPGALAQEFIDDLVGAAQPALSRRAFSRA